MVKGFNSIFRKRILKTIYLNKFSGVMDNRSSQKIGISILKKSNVFYKKTSLIRINHGSLTVGSSWFDFFLRGSSVILKDHATIEINGNFRLYSGVVITVNPNAKLELGSGYINMNSSITCFESISIGKNVVISENVVIRDSDNHKITYEGKSNLSKTLPIVIEDDVWVGTNVLILKGVTIGKGSVIAAGSVLTQNIPPYSLAGGVPARVLRNDVRWE